jgi:hypothetical protein
MKSTSKAGASQQQQTFPVSNDVFKMVYDAPSSLPGKYKWVTADQDVRQIEKLLGMPQKTIGAPLWVSGDQKSCPKCQREINWLDIVNSATKQVHSGAMIAKVVLGEQKYVNTEAPRAIADLSCFNCGSKIEGLRSFKCHNWAYAIGKIRKVILEMNKVINKK